jgi:hypothetical protein
VQLLSTIAVHPVSHQLNSCHSVTDASSKEHKCRCLHAPPDAALHCHDATPAASLAVPASCCLQDMLAKDLSEGQYFVTGNLTREIFADDCR